MNIQYAVWELSLLFNSFEATANVKTKGRKEHDFVKLLNEKEMEMFLSHLFVIGYTVRYILLT